MKKCFFYFFLAAFGFSILFSSGYFLQSCKKKDLGGEFVSGRPSPLGYTYTGVSKWNDMLHFTNQSAFEDVLLQLWVNDTNYVDTLPDHDSILIIPEVVLEDFEDGLNFYSLRKDIKVQCYDWLNAGNEPNTTTYPDAFWLKDEYLRTVLNPSLEVRIGDIIWKFLDRENHVAIVDASLTTLQQIRESPMDAWSHENTVVYTKYKVQKGGCKADFQISQSTITPNQVDFENYSTGVPDLTYHWSFGDGTFSSQKNPYHFYNSPGDYSVCLTIIDADDCTASVCKTYSTVACKAGFSFKRNNLDVEFSPDNKYTNGYQYFWEFGDSYSDTKQGGQNVSHKYHSAGTYHVCLTVTGPAGCSTKVCQDVVIDPDCCDGWDREKENGLKWNNDNYKLITVIWTTSAYPFYNRLGAKTKHFVKRNWPNGWWKEAKASATDARINGTVYDKDCGDPNLFGVFSDPQYGEHKSNVNFPFGRPFRVAKDGFHSYHYVTDGVIAKSHDMYLTDDCN